MRKSRASNVEASPSRRARAETVRAPHVPPLVNAHGVAVRHLAIDPPRVDPAEDLIAAIGLDNVFQERAQRQAGGGAERLVAAANPNTDRVRS